MEQTLARVSAELAVARPTLLILGVISVSLSSLLYTWIWYRPRHFVQLCVRVGADPCARMAFLAHALKCLQFLLLAACTNWSTLIANAQTTRLVVPAALFLGAGQHLNAMVYLRLKQVGVYYGARFGRHVPWVHGWPYSHIRDPQYVGALLSVVGAALLGGESTHVILCAWGLNYLYLIVLESQVPHSISDDIPAIAPRKVGRPRAVSSAALNDASSPSPTPKSKRTPRTPALPVPGRVQRRKRGASTTRV